MKKSIILTSLITMMAGSFAQAGAYNISCIGTGGGFILEKASLKLYGNQINYVSEIPNLDFGDTEINDNSVQLSSTSKRKIYKNKTFKDECGNPGQEIVFEQNIQIKNLWSGEILERNFPIVCALRSISGHCF
ncbi:MAG: hypothetical protein M9962_12135 [Oligoflexia bacterium]|nr:hypothetical protein [Oligoflexia bacterium]